MKALMKVLDWIKWISAGIGVIFILLAAISVILGEVIIGNHLANLLTAANTFFLVTVLLFLFTHLNQYKKE